MIWVTWRQFRWQGITAAAALIVVAVVLAATRPGLDGSYAAARLPSCHANCAAAASTFLDTVGNLDHVLFFGSVFLMYLAPAVMGLFWGAPLIAREVEAGTHRIAWNQSVTRTRWTLVKLGLVGLAAVATAGLLSLMVTWWASPIDAASLVGGSAQAASTAANGAHITVDGFAEARLDPAIFDARGVVPLGYAALAFSLGVTAGVLVRRTVLAMALTLVAFVTIQVVMPIFVRPYLLPAAHYTAPVTKQGSVAVNTNAGTGLSTIQLTAPFAKPGAWVLSDILTTPSGGKPADAIMTPAGPELTQLPGACIPTASGLNRVACEQGLAAIHLRESVTYQPASRFWPLQWIETGIYLVLAAGLGWVCVWEVRRRRAP